jgi:predicted HTH transcriptional regulator
MQDLWAAIRESVETGRETEDIELKESLDLLQRPHRAEFARDVSAMANRCRGCIVVGARDARHRTPNEPAQYVPGWQGDLDETERVMRDTLATFCEPPPRILTHLVPYRTTEKNLLVVEIPKSGARPHAIIRESGDVRAHEFWVRDGPMVRRATSAEVEEMILEQRRVIVVNFSHPLTDEQKEQARHLTSVRIEEVINVPVQFDHNRAFQEQALDAVNRAGLTSHQWQTRDIVVNLPGFAPAAAVVLAEIHGRMGHFPTILRLRPVHGEGAPRYEITEAINLQRVRDEAREGR